LLLFGLAVATLVPRFLNLFLEEGREYVRYGFHFFIARLVRALSNTSPLNLLFGDSSYITDFLQWLGYDLSKVVQTGSNFGLAQAHDNPFQCHFGTRTMISDGLTILNAQHSNTAFKLSRNGIGDDGFVGNNVFYPVGAKLGNNCLIATKAMLPLDGVVRENVGLLGSPSFEIPRVSGDDKGFDLFADTERKHHGLQRKNRSNLLTMLMFVSAGLSYSFVLLVLGYVVRQSSAQMGIADWVMVSNGFLLFSILYFIVLERAALGFGKMYAITVPIYDPEYWRVERMWKFSASQLSGLWLGTPFRSILHRALGVRLGKKVFDDGLAVTEKTLVEIGDYCNFNIRCVLQSHSLEQGRYKSGYTKVGNCCSIETNAFIHYGVSIGDGAVIGPDSFLMKGETVEPGTVWQGNPARAV